MQKTINNEGRGEFPVQVWEFKENFPAKYEKLLKNCNWEVEESKGIVRMYFFIKKDGEKSKIPVEKLKSYIRTTCNKSSLGKKVSCIPFLPIINLLNDFDFQVKQIEDFVTRLNTVLAIKPPNGKYSISQYIKSKLGKALFLDHHINAPEIVKWDLKKALALFQQKKPNVSLNPEEWGSKHSVYEREFLEIYAPMRRMTDPKKRYNNLKKKL